MTKTAEKTHSITPEQFVKVFQGAKTLADACQKLGMKQSAVTSRAVMYRKHGVELKKFGRAKRINWDNLKEVASQN